MSRADARIANIISITQRLSALAAAEIEMLATGDTAEIAAHQKEKAGLAQVYQVELKALRANHSWLRSSGPADVDRLKAATRRFQEILEQHRCAMAAAKTVTERLLKTIGEEVAKRQWPVKGYDKTATVRMNSGAHTAPAVPVALNQIV